ncbi:MAG: endolytic transglycosylase MltG, partial [Cyanobacteria bacterium J06638_6]
RFETAALPIYQQTQTDLSLLEWATLASIVEKEAVVPDERTLIAGVFTNRLAQNIPLGADPTVEYGLGIVQTKETPLTFNQVGTPSPYNTYLNPGLPPTPIASAGKASLEATLAPAPTDYLFFVARYDGTHVFSRTLAEHENARDNIRATIDN